MGAFFYLYRQLPVLNSFGSKIVFFLRRTEVIAPQQALTRIIHSSSYQTRVRVSRAFAGPGHLQRRHSRHQASHCDIQEASRMGCVY